MTSPVFLIAQGLLDILHSKGTDKHEILKKLPAFLPYQDLPATLKNLNSEDRGSVQGLISLLSCPVNQAVFERLPGLKVVANYAVGYNNIDLNSARKHQVAVCNTPGVLTNATADLTLALILACARNLLPGDRFTREGHFTGWQADLFLGLDLHGARLGILGLGRIGQAVARRARSFGMHISYHNRNRLDHDLELELQADYLPLERLIQESDILTLHCPLNEQTKNIMNQDRLQAMKAGAILINTARGSMVDEKALVDVLNKGPLKAAGLDVYQDEPQVDPGLLELENTVLLPHIGSAGQKTRHTMAIMNLESLLAAWQKRTIPWQVQ